jgi:hypothetical protein
MITKPKLNICLRSKRKSLLVSLTPNFAGEATEAAGTAWLWARPEMASSVDVLFLDGAGQMSLAKNTGDLTSCWELGFAWQLALRISEGGQFAAEDKSESHDRHLHAGSRSAETPRPKRYRAR